MLTRRTLLASPVALAACATTDSDDGAEALLRRAIDAAGGQAALERARVLAWTGSARIHIGEQVIEIGVNTVVEPFTYARSETWLLSQGPSSARVLEITSDGGWATRNGERTAMPAVQVAHERQQYAMYGLMRFVTLRDPGATFALDGANTLRVTHPQAADATLTFGDDDKLIEAHNTVVNSEPGGAPIAQVFRFMDTIEGGGVRWPRRMSITQSGVLFFELTLDSFTPRQQR